MKNKIKNWWKGLKYWQKGGIIGFISGIIIMIVFFLFIIIQVPPLPFFIKLIEKIGWIKFIIGILMPAIVFSIMGILNGLLYSGYKKKLKGYSAPIVFGGITVLITGALKYLDGSLVEAITGKRYLMLPIENWHLRAFISAGIVFLIGYVIGLCFEYKKKKNEKEK